MEERIDKVLENLEKIYAEIDAINKSTEKEEIKKEIAEATEGYDKIHLAMHNLLKLAK